jgi:hypothetical protein
MIDRAALDDGNWLACRIHPTIRSWDLISISSWPDQKSPGRQKPADLGGVLVFVDGGLAGYSVAGRPQDNFRDLTIAIVIATGRVANLVQPRLPARVSRLDQSSQHDEDLFDAHFM